MLKSNTIMLLDEDITNVNLVDRISVPSQRTLTDAGQMHVPCKFARTGSQKYLAKQVFTTPKLLEDQNLKPNDVIELHRDEETVFAKDSMETFRSAPVTIGHPKDKDGKPIAVTSDNSKDLQVGVLEGMPTRDEDTLGGVLVLTAQEAIDALEEGTQELSAGYTCDIAIVDSKFYQRNVRANHIAIVPKGRAGSSCRISDEALEVERESSYDKEELAMGTKHELEHTSDEGEAAKIAKDHLDEDPKYYTNLSKCGMGDEDLDKAKELLKSHELVVNDELTISQAMTLLSDELSLSKKELATQKELVVDFKETAEEAEVAVEAMKVELADAKVAAEEDVVVRCEAIENARLIADMRDLGDKSVAQIQRLVVEDQMPNKNLEGKSEAYVEAMFDLLIDSAKGETPMSKLMKQQESHLVVDAKPYVDPVTEARQKMIKRQSAK